MGEGAAAYPGAAVRPRLRERDWFHTATRVSLGIAALLAVAAVLGFVVLSPFVLARLGGVGGLDWNRLSAIGETYGAAATLFTALSLGGIAVSLLLQAKDSKTAREQAVRTFHFELVRMKLDDPKLLWAAGWPRPELRTPAEQDTDRIRQHLYANMWVYYWLMQYEIGRLTEANLRALLSFELFNGEVGRRYWASTGETFAVMRGRRTKRFFRIVEEEYRKVLASGRPPVPASGPVRLAPAPTAPRRSWPPGAAALLLGGAGAAAGLAALRARRRRR